MDGSIAEGIYQMVVSYIYIYLYQSRNYQQSCWRGNILPHQSKVSESIVKTHLGIFGSKLAE